MPDELRMPEVAQPLVAAVIHPRQRWTSGRRRRHLGTRGKVPSPVRREREIIRRLLAGTKPTRLRPKFGTATHPGKTSCSVFARAAVARRDKAPAQSATARALDPASE